ncbi:MAG: alkaline phosphatase family protein, partial [Flavobacteriaceae bacterium]|nr:alkaline phosphatase family protein [Flavobacteriaceae bacterium]
MKRLFLLLFLPFIFVQCQTKKNPHVEIKTKTKLVVGIVVDQMRYDYLTRFWDHYSDGGFKRMVNQGFNFKNNHYNYTPTYTGPGHASVYTGTSPGTHGIIGNSWYSKEAGKMVYCAEDASVLSLGTKTKAGQMSPHRMKTTTIADINRIHTQMQGKTIGISLKDRGAILPAGHTANAAYWFQGKEEGKWISSSYYMDALPEWVNAFNESDQAEGYFKTWDTYYDISKYTQSGADENSYEWGFSGKETPTFPYDLDALKAENGQFEIIKNSPYGNNLITDFAIAALEAEQLGDDDHTDFLTVSYSSTDMVGHNFGVNSKEVQDSYIRLDLDLQRLLEHIDAKVGKGNYTVFLTSDHGAVHVPNYLKDLKIPAGYFDSQKFETDLNALLMGKYHSKNLIANFSNFQIFFNHDEVDRLKINTDLMQEAVAKFALDYPQMDKVFTRKQMEDGNYTKDLANLVQNGFSQKRSGDVMLLLDTSVISYGPTGSTHGSANTYDTHVPLLFFGAGINQGSSSRYTKIIDIAPTISSLLGIVFTNGSTGDV